MPCLRRATSLAYTDADEDAERLLSFGDSSATGSEADEWVETHAGRKPSHDAANPGTIDDIPDLDGDDHPAGGAGVGGVTAGMGNISLGGGAAAAETPDLDDIPDMEEEGLEEGDEATAVAPKAAPAVIDARCVLDLYSCSITLKFLSFKVTLKSLGAICYKSELTMS